MLQHRRCPHCGYDLRLLPDDCSDGATVCPECGCAWKLVGEANGGESSSGEAITPRQGADAGNAHQERTAR